MKVKIDVFLSNRIRRTCLLFCTLLAVLSACTKPKHGKKCPTGPGLADTQVMASLPEKTIALTFDDGPDKNTEELGRYLQQVGAPSTFFAIGGKALLNPQPLKLLRAQGHLVANHTNSHPDLTKSGSAAQEIRRADAAIAPHISGNIFLFRAPYGSFTANNIQDANGAGLGKYYGPIHWDIGEELTETTGADWACVSQNMTARVCADRYLSEIREKNGGVILMHDSVSYIVDLVRYVVEPLKAEGWNFIRLDESPTIAEQILLRGGTPGASGGSDYCYDY